MKVFRRGYIALFFLLALNSVGVFAQSSDGDRILGVYRALGQDTDVLSDVRFTKVGDNLYEGRVIWVEDKGLYDKNGNIELDTRNQEPELRCVPVDQIRVVWGISYDTKKGSWKGGKIYNPVDGKTYDVQISFNTPDQLKLRGYLGTPMLGRNFYWDKVDKE